jgi:hypothetical protein
MHSLEVIIKNQQTAQLRMTKLGIKTKKLYIYKQNTITWDI